MWQVSGAHGRITPKVAIQNMFDYKDAGFTTWDLADHYGPAEDFIGEFRRQLLAHYGQAALSEIQAFTKWVPRPGKMTKKIVADNIDIARRRMDTETLDLLQFHWWEYRDLNYLEALRYMTELKEEGKIKHLSLTNFDTEHLNIILQNGINIKSNQVQYSLVDRRPQVHMSSFCQQHNLQLFAYGSLCGGFLTEKYLGKPEPRGSELNTVSLRKYKNMIDAWGGWQLLQELLTALKLIAEKHHVSIANIAVRYVLEQPAVAGVIIGTRLSISQHIEDNAAIFNFGLDTADYQQINTILNQSRNLYQLIGDCGDEYRR